MEEDTHAVEESQRSIISNDYNVEWWQPYCPTEQYVSMECYPWVKSDQPTVTFIKASNGDTWAVFTVQKRPDIAVI